MFKIWIIFLFILTTLSCSDEVNAKKKATEPDNNGEAQTVCDFKSICENGACTCQTGPVGEACCDPDICGDAPNSCKKLCLVCECQGSGCNGSPNNGVGNNGTGNNGTGNNGTGNNGGPPDPIVCVPSTCWDDCNTDHGKLQHRSRYLFRSLWCRRHLLG